MMAPMSSYPSARREATTAAQYVLLSASRAAGSTASRTSVCASVPRPRAFGVLAATKCHAPEGIVRRRFLRLDYGPAEGRVPSKRRIWLDDALFQECDNSSCPTAAAVIRAVSRLDTGRRTVKAIVVTDQAAGTA